MKKLLILTAFFISVLAVSAQETYEATFASPFARTGLKPAIAIRASGDVTLMRMKFDWHNDAIDGNSRYNPKPFVGATGYLGAAYEHPVSHNCAIAGGLGLSYGKAFRTDTQRNAFYSYFSMTTVYAEIYYALRLEHFYLNVGLRGGLMPLMVTEYRNGKDMFRGRMNNNHYTRGNIYGLIQLGYTTGRMDIGVDFNYALLSQFKEGFSWPLTGTYNSIRTMHMNVGINLAYRFSLGK